MPLDHEETAAGAEGFREEGGGPDPDFVFEVEAAVALGDSKRVHELVGDLHEADLGALLELLSHEARPRLVELMGADFDFTALMEVGEATREDILEELPVETLVEGVRDLESDDAVAILETLEPAEQAEVLEALPAQDRIVLRRSLDYPDGSAGRLMQTTLIAVPPFWTAGRRGRSPLRRGGFRAGFQPPGGGDFAAAKATKPRRIARFALAPCQIGENLSAAVCIPACENLQSGIDDRLSHPCCPARIR